MAWNKKEKKTYDIEFVACELSTKDKDKLEAWIAEYELELGTILDTYMNEGYRVSIKYDPGNECFMASMTQQDNNHPNANKLLSGRSDNALEALWIVLYKHIAVLNGGSWETHRTHVNWG